MALKKAGYEVFSVTTEIHVNQMTYPMKAWVYISMSTSKLPVLIPSPTRGIECPLYDQIHKLKKQNYHVTIALDYAWLQSGYYESNYGVDWLSDKAQILFQAGADQISYQKIFLPTKTKSQMSM